jgi:hypothetical protein
MSSGMLRRAVSYELIFPWRVLALRTSETSVSLYEATRRNIPEDTCSYRHENLKSHHAEDNSVSNRGK